MGCSYSVPTRVTAAPATTTPSMSATTGIQVGYVTDVEGNVDYFDEWVKHSGILRYSSADELEFTNDGAYFVFGGDAMDRCDGGMRFTRRLVALKKRHPDRVFLLAGNRDLNKVRFTSELAESDLSRPPSDGERERLIAMFDSTPEKERRTAIEDLFWALMTSREFLFQH